MAKALDAISNAKLEEEKKKSANGPKRPKEKHMKDVDELDEETYRKDFEEETNTLKQQLAVQAVFDDAELEKRCQEDAKVEAEERRKEHEILEQQRKKEQDRANYVRELQEKTKQRAREVALEDPSAKGLVVMKRDDDEGWGSGVKPKGKSKGKK